MASRYPRRAEVTGRLVALPVPLLALVLFLVAGSQVETALHSLSLLPRMLGAFLAFLLGAVWYPAG